MNNYQVIDNEVIFDCGCVFTIDDKGKIVFDVDTHNPNNTLDIECPYSYKILADGITEGIFQLKSQLGNSWCKKLQPTELEHLVALGSLLRPGALQSKDSKGNNITVRYERKKNGKMELSTYHPIVDKIFEKTYGENIFQEQSLELVKQCAGFSLSEADTLRKGIGKKIASVVADCKKLFLSKGLELGIFNKEKLEEIFSWIEASQRYSFNRSLVGNTNVFTYKGFKQINELKIGDFVLCPNDSFKDEEYAQVTNIFDHGNQEVWKITIENDSICCTINHKFLCNDNKIRRLKDIFGKYDLLTRFGIRKIYKLEYQGILPTYDIEINNKHHLFFASSFITSNSHATGYGVLGYMSAYEKAHFPLEFYQYWLINEDKREEYAKLINEAKLFDIAVYPPDLRDFRTDFYARKGNIYFGLHNIKGLVKKDLDEIGKIFMSKDWNFADIGEGIRWMDFLYEVLENVSSKTVECLIHSGSIDCFGTDRAILAYEYERWAALTPVEKKCFINLPHKEDIKLAEFIELLILESEGWYKEKLLQYNEKVEKRKNSTRKRSKEPKPFVEPKEDRRLPKLRETLQELTDPLYNITDSFDSIIFSEENLLGVALTKHKTDEIINAVETATCLEVLNGRRDYVVLRVKVDEARAYKCKNGASTGKDMCFLKVSDKTSQMSAVAFPDCYEEFRHLLTRNNLIFISGNLDKDSFIVKRCYNVS